jgi:RNA polymerase sigma factor (sigma-70 family)
MTTILLDVWHYESVPMDSRGLFEANLPVVERAIARVCRDGRLSGADAEDFASSARIALLADDCAILRKHEGRSSLDTYLTIVIRRLLVDQRRAEGRWSASAEAKRRGAAAVLLERLVHRDQRTLDDAIGIVSKEHPEAGRRELAAIAAALPPRPPRARIVELAEGDEERFAATSSADERINDLDRGRRSDSASRAVRKAMTTMSAEDRLILRMRFHKGKSIADIARALGLEQRPLYRRIEALLVDLRRALTHAGLDASAVADLIGGAREGLDFGPAFGKSGPVPPSMVEERGSSGGETS